jgi:hypothetical protein
MMKVALLVLLLAGTCTGKAHGQIIEQQSSDPQLAVGLGVVDKRPLRVLVNVDPAPHVYDSVKDDLKRRPSN